MATKRIPDIKKIYFACSISGGRDHAHMYQDIADAIKLAGGQLLSELFADKNVTSETGVMSGLNNSQVWKRDINWVREANGVIAEVTQPSLGVGYEVAKAEEWRKPVLALFYANSGRRLSPMIAGSPGLMVFEYHEIGEVQPAITAFIEKI